MPTMHQKPDRRDVYVFIIFSGNWVERNTPEFLNKKHLNFGQGLEFLKFGQGNRGLNQQNRRKSKETIRNNKGKRAKLDKKIRGRDPYFLFNNFLFNIFSVYDVHVGGRQVT